VTIFVNVQLLIMRGLFNDLPELLYGMGEYLVQADQFERNRVPNPVVAVHCKMYALGKGLAERDRSDKSAMDFLLKLMDHDSIYEIETEKIEKISVNDAQMQVACPLFLCSVHDCIPSLPAPASAGRDVSTKTS